MSKVFEVERTHEPVATYEHPDDKTRRLWAEHSIVPETVSEPPNIFLDMEEVNHAL